MIKKQTEKKMKRLRTDNGMEFYSMEFDQFYKNEELCGIVHVGTHHNRMELKKG